MSDCIRSPAQMADEARAHLDTVDTITTWELKDAIGIGPPFADKLIDQFQREGLISGPDRHYRHNVRSASGELEAPTTRPRRTWEEYVLKMLQWLVRMRGRDGQA